MANSEETTIAPVERGKRLRLLRHMLQKTIKEFSQLCAVGESTIRMWEQGKLNGLSESGAMKVLSVLKKTTTIDCDLDWLLYGEEYGEKPILREDEKQNEISLFKSTYDSIIYRVQDNTLAPFFVKGDIIGGICVDIKNIAVLVNELCIIQIMEKEQFIAEIVSSSKQTGCYNLMTYHLDKDGKKTSELHVDQCITSVAPIKRIWRS